MDMVLYQLKIKLDDKKRMVANANEEIIKTEKYLITIKESKEISERCIKELDMAIAILQPLSTANQSI